MPQDSYTDNGGPLLLTNSSQDNMTNIVPFRTVGPDIWAWIRNFWNEVKPIDRPRPLMAVRIVQPTQLQYTTCQIL